MLRVFAIAVFTLLSLVFSVVSPAVLAETTGNDKRILTLHGSNTIGASLAPKLARGYLETLSATLVERLPTGIENETIVRGKVDGQWLEIYIAAHGSSTGFKSLGADATDIAMSSRPIKDKEVAALSNRAAMRDIQHEHVIGIDGLAVIVHPENPLNALDKASISAIFRGEITNWRQLGGNDVAIALHARDNKSGTWDTFRKLVLNKQPLAQGAKRYESNDALARAVRNNRNAIGFVGLASVVNVKALAVSDDETRALLPKQLTVATEDYPLSRRLFLYSLATQGHPNRFITWALGQQGQQQVEKTGFVSQNIISIPQEVISNAPDAYQQLSGKAQRLSVNFRFAEGSASLDNKAKRDLVRLEEFISQPENKTREIWLVGFSDSKSRNSHEQVLSQHRALAIKRKLYAHPNIGPIMGLGSFLPVASNSDQSAKSKNGRVEIWIARQEQ